MDVLHRRPPLSWAEGGAHVFGRPFSEEETLDRALSVILDEDRDRVLRDFESAIAASRAFHSEFRVRWPNGHIHWLESRGTRSAADPNIWHGVTLDITDRKKAEAALVRSEKLAAIGRLSATVAHEVNNPLEAVTNLLYLAMSQPDLPPQAKDYLQRADQELARLASIARRTLSFVRPKSAVGPVDVIEIVDAVIDMFQPRCTARGAEIHIRCNVELTLPMPADDLRQILTNIVSNACDALPPSDGIIEIEIVRHDKTVSISIRDNGTGISPDNLTRVFEPFFTTKEDVGTGIGLWVTRDLVDKNGGRISVQTHFLPPGFNTMFRVEFPLA
jgi:PAS domain S-box-containing protein